MRVVCCRKGACKRTRREERNLACGVALLVGLRRLLREGANARVGRVGRLDAEGRAADHLWRLDRRGRRVLRLQLHRRRQPADVPRRVVDLRVRERELREQYAHRQSSTAGAKHQIGQGTCFISSWVEDTVVSGLANALAAAHKTHDILYFYVHELFVYTIAKLKLPVHRLAGNSLYYIVEI